MACNNQHQLFEVNTLTELIFSYCPDLALLGFMRSRQHVFGVGDKGIDRICRDLLYYNLGKSKDHILDLLQKTDSLMFGGCVMSCASYGRFYSKKLRIVTRDLSKFLDYARLGDGHDNYTMNLFPGTFDYSETLPYFYCNVFKDRIWVTEYRDDNFQTLEWPIMDYMGEIKLGNASHYVHNLELPIEEFHLASRDHWDWYSIARISLGMEGVKLHDQGEWFSEPPGSTKYSLEQPVEIVNDYLQVKLLSSDMMELI